jgi:CBS domain containing-hemolysin-like protein
MTAMESFVIILLILINGMLAMAEIAVVSARKVRLQQRLDEDDAGARGTRNVLMTPRPELVWLDLNASPGEMQRQLIASPHTRFPVGMGALTTWTASCAPKIC